MNRQAPSRHAPRDEPGAHHAERDGYSSDRSGNKAAGEASMSVLLSVQGLTKAYGPRPLFTELSLDLRAGERVGLIGPNGAGKSTLLRLLAAREEPDAGRRMLRRAAPLA